MKVPEKYYDEIFVFDGQWGQPSACGLKIVDKKENIIVVVTELYQDNPGTSVTSAGFNLAKQICEKKGLDFSKIIYLECTPDTNSVLSFYNEQYFEVTLNKHQQPQYRKVLKEELEKMIL
ncbi:MAG: hypothetical protein LBI45_03965 [Bacteroidales bacterium]|jgi:hypothetical protein|nr:hypothetical protein [Bacteroidales bacterium]